MPRLRTVLTAATVLAATQVASLGIGEPAALADDTGTGPTAAAAHGWGTPTYADEFDGTSLDLSRWTPYDGPGNAGAGRRSPAQLSVGGGVLTVDGTADGTTGGMNDTASHRYGRWETRMRVPAGDRRYHPVLLLWPTSGQWPQAGEVDYAETHAAAPDMSFFLHYSAQNQQTYAQQSLDLTQWHTYAVEWTPSGITGYVDGVAWFEDSDPSHQPTGPMHSSIQLDWVPDGTSATTPSSIQVDWTRYYDL